MESIRFFMDQKYKKSNTVDFESVSIIIKISVFDTQKKAYFFRISSYVSKMSVQNFKLISKVVLILHRFCLEACILIW